MKAEVRVLSPPRLILFDLDDTLADYTTARARRLEHAFRSQLAHLTVEERDQLLPVLVAQSIALSPHGTDHFPALLAAHRVSAAGAAEAAAWYRQHRFAHLALFPDALAVIAAIRVAVGPGGKLGVITNGPAGVQRDKAALLGITDLVDFLWISGEVGIEKPDPRIFDLALATAGVTATDAIMIGDAPEFDMLGARNAGLRMVWFNRRRTVWPYQDWWPEHTIDELAALPALLTASVFNSAADARQSRA